MRGKLEKGEFIKNYKELCKVFDLKTTTGNAKIAQMKEIERFYKLEKKGYGFTVVEVYDEPLPKIDGRKNNGRNISNTKYEDLMDKVILRLLLTYDGYIEESYSALMDYYFNFFTPEYKKLYEMGYSKYAKSHNLSKGLVKTYQQKMKGVIETALITSLERLQRQGKITYTKQVKINNEELADKNMRTLINKTEQKVYKELGLSRNDRSVPSKNKKFKKKVCKYLDIWTYYNVYIIKLIDNSVQEVEDDEEELKQRFIKSVIDATKNKTNKGENGKYRPYSYKKYEEQLDKLTKLIWKLSDTYTSEYDLKLLMAGKDINKQQEQEVTNLDMENYTAYYDYDMQDLKDGIPF